MTTGSARATARRWFRKSGQHGKSHRVGIIKHRALSTLKVVAAEFGEIAASEGERLFVAPRGIGGLKVRLAYDSGDFILSRVYNLAIGVELEDAARGLVGMELKFTRNGAVLLPSRGPKKERSAFDRLLVEQLQARLEPWLSRVDLISLRFVEQQGKLWLEAIPAGGSYVWVLIPPVSYWARFPEGEPSRLVSMLVELRGVLNSLS